MPEFQPVNPTVELSDGDISPTSVETTVTGSESANSAVITGYMDDPTVLERNDEVEVRINEETVFAGFLKNAKQHQDNEITIEAYGTFFDIHNAFVTLHTTQPRFLNEIARDLLDDFEDVAPDPVSVVGKFVDPNTVPLHSMYVAPGSDFFRGDSPSNKSWGGGHGGESLTWALNQLADGLFGFMWTDRRNVFRIEPFTADVYEPEYVIETESGAGQNTEDAVKRVLVETKAGSVGTNPAESWIHSLVHPPAQGDDTSVSSGSDVYLQDNNITTQQEADKRVLSEFVKINLESDSGSITVAGATDPSPWDDVIVPETSNSPLSGGTYTASAVTQSITPDDGWTTTIELRPEVEPIIGNLDISGIDQLVE